MERTLTLRGVPHSLAVDGWWLASSPDRPDPATGAASRRMPKGLAILALVVLADVLFWDARPGLSAALFAAAVFAFAVWDGALRHWEKPALLLTLAALPVVNLVQVLSLGFLGLGLAAALVWAHHPTALTETVARSTARFVSRLPWEWTIRLNPAQAFAAIGRAGPLRTHLRDWGFPLGGGLVILALLLEANPVLAGFLTLDIAFREAVLRLIFWAGIALLVAPFLAPVPVAPSGTHRAVTLPSLGLNQGSVLRALFLFNVLIGVQTATDLGILFGGATLPDGMTLAEFAQRGAYPLLAAAILAGGFALAARPFLGGHRLVRPLLLLWIAQNVILCVAAALRLELYIESFSLTYLRLYALIWMALVAAGLGLIFWQVLRERTNGWLFLRSLGLGVATLYACCFVNFAAVIATVNLRQPDPDRMYLCFLGPLAAGPILDSGLGTAEGSWVSLGECGMLLPQPGDWREWGFRSWSASRYVHARATAESLQ